MEIWRQQGQRVEKWGQRSRGKFVWYINCWFMQYEHESQGGTGQAKWVVHKFTSVDSFRPFPWRFEMHQGTKNHTLTRGKETRKAKAIERKKERERELWGFFPLACLARQILVAVSIQTVFATSNVWVSNWRVIDQVCVLLALHSSILHTWQRRLIRPNSALQERPRQEIAGSTIARPMPRTFFAKTSLFLGWHSMLPLVFGTFKSMFALDPTLPGTMTKSTTIYLTDCLPSSRFGDVSFGVRWNVRTHIRFKSPQSFKLYHDALSERHAKKQPEPVFATDPPNERPIPQTTTPPLFAEL